MKGNKRTSQKMSKLMLLLTVLLYSSHDHLVSGESTSSNDDRRLDHRQNPTHQHGFRTQLSRKTARDFDREEKLIEQLMHAVEQLNNAVDQQKRSIDTLNQTLIQQNQPQLNTQQALNHTRGECIPGFTYLKHQCASCYKLLTETQVWKGAVESCRALHPDAHLAFIGSAEEQEIVVTWLKSQPIGREQCPLNSRYAHFGRTFWLGAQRSNPTDGTTPFYWKTADGAIYNIHYSTWIKNEPNNFDNTPESCVFMAAEFNFQWNDSLCWANSCSLCEYDP